MLPAFCNGPPEVAHSKVISFFNPVIYFSSSKVVWATTILFPSGSDA